VTAPLILLAFALVVGSGGARWLRAAQWPNRAPRLGILAWQGLTLSVLASVVLAGVALALPSIQASGSLAELLHACAVAMREHYSTPGGAAVSAGGAAVAIGAVGRTLYCLAKETVDVRRARSTQREALGLVARRHNVADMLVVEHATPAVYCLPGRQQEVIFTSAALATLNDEQVDAVLAHERAHLRGRHDVVLAVARALQVAFPFVSVFRVAREELGRLIEMHADDAALGKSDRRVLATALVRLAEGSTPAGTLGAGGASALARVRRLAEPARPLGVVGTLTAAALTLGLVVIPIMIAAAPAVSAAAMHYCPAGFPT